MTGGGDGLYEVALGIGLAVAIGTLIGLERERRASARGRSTFAGARTFPLIAVAGALAALAARAVGPSAILAGFVAVTLLVCLAYWREYQADSTTGMGITTEVSALLVFAIASVPFLDGLGLDFRARLVVTASLGVVVMTLLALRDPLHGFAERLSVDDLYAAVRFALLAAVALPLLPDQAWGPYGVLNPYRVGIVIVLLAAIGFVGYVAVRVLGARRGISVTAFFGGLVSSTAVTLSLSGRGRAEPALARVCALGIVLSSTVMFPRIWAELLVIRRELVPALLVPLAAMLAVGVAGWSLLWRRVGRESGGEDEPRFANPFTMRQAVKLGLLYAAVRLLAAAAYDQLGHGGLYLTAALTGITDVDAIAISVGRMHAGGLDERVAVTAITLAAVTNTLTKSGMALALGGRKVGLPVVSVLVPAAAAGIVATLVGG